MASRYWVGGTGNWDASDTTHWSATSNGAGGQTVPTSADAVTFDANSGGGTVTLTATANCASFTGGAFTGTFNTNGQTMNCTGAFSFSGTGTRTLTLGSSTMNCGTWSFSNSTNLTFNSNTSTIILNSNNYFIYNAGLTFYNVSLIGTGIGLISGAGTFNNLSIIPPTGKFHEVSVYNGIVVNGVLTVSGFGANERLWVRGNYDDVSTITVNGSISAQYVDFWMINGAGTASWNLSGITGGSGDCTGNTGITFTSPTTQYFTNTSGGLWSTSGNWTSRVPLPQDTVIINTAFTTSRTVDCDMPRAGKSVDFTGATWTTSLTFRGSVHPVVIFGSLTLITGLTIYASSFEFQFLGLGSNVIKTYGVSITKPIRFNCIGYTYELDGDLTCSQTLNITRGTLSTTSNNYVVTVAVLNTGTDGVLSAFDSWIYITSLSFSNSGNITGSNYNIKFTSTSNSNLSLTLNSKTYNNLWFDRGTSTGSNIIYSNNTINEIKDTGTVAHSLIFAGNSTNTISSFIVNGSAGQLISINSTNTNAHTLIKAGGGTVQCSYLDIQHSVATPSNTWYANASTNNQGVATAGSGWTFGFVPMVAGTGTFIMNIFTMSANFIYGRKMISDVGSFVLTGINSILNFGKRMINTVGAFTLTGISNAFRLGRNMIASTGSFILTGIDALLIRVGGFIMVASTGVFNLTGIDNILRIALHMINSVGTFTLTGISNSFIYGRKIIADVGAFTLTGISNILSKGILMIASIGTFTLTGISNAFLKSLKVIADVGNFMVTGYGIMFKGSGAWKVRNLAKNISSWIDEIKHSSTASNTTKNNSTVINQNKNTASITNINKNSSSWVNQNK